MTDNKLQDLIEVSQKIGCDIAFVQGGGGNTSVKIDDKKMAVKASGGLLRDMTINKGLSIVDYGAMLSYIASPDEDDNIFNKNLQSMVISMSDRPSMETGCHAQLGTFVVHTHSVYVNLLTCSVEGMDLATKLFPDALWIPYTTPGRDLTIAIRDLINNNAVFPKVIFLKNHGVMVSAKTSWDAYEIHEYINQKIRDKFDLDEAVYNPHAFSKDLDFIRSHILFPDQVVYTQASSQFLKSQAARETIWAYNYILKVMETLGLSADFLNQSHAKILLGLDSEKHRQRVVKG